MKVYIHMLRIRSKYNILYLLKHSQKCSFLTVLIIPQKLNFYSLYITYTDQHPVDRQTNGIKQSQPTNAAVQQR